MTAMSTFWTSYLQRRPEARHSAGGDGDMTLNEGTVNLAGEMASQWYTRAWWTTASVQREW